MMKLKYVIGLLLAVAKMGNSITIIETRESYPHNARLKSGNIALHWRVVGGILTMEVHAETLGWVGIGLSPNGGMAGSDIIVGWVKDGVAFITDRHAEGNQFPKKDLEQNVELISGSEQRGYTILKFTRQLAACERGADLEITDDTQRIIWAYGENDPDGDDLQPKDYHGTRSRGGQSLILLDPSDSLREKFGHEKDLSTFAAVNDKLNLPPIETYYHCKIVELPEIAEKHHIIMAKPVVTEGNEQIVHHMLLYQCGSSLEDRTALNESGICFSPEMPAHYRTCQTMIAGFAIGSGEFHFPSDTGYPLGGEKGSRYLQIQIHYDNPQLRSDIIDSSGVEITYTSKLREFDTGMLMLGNTVDGFSHFMPPNAEKFVTVGHCTSNCLTEAMEYSSKSKITVFSALLHTHKRGRAVQVRHIRNGTELPYIMKDNYFDYNFQEIRYATEERDVLPSDSIRIECAYNTKNQKEFTLGGPGGREEMCIAFVFYYPRIDLIDCTSVPDATESYSIFNISRYNVTGYEGLKDVYVLAPEQYSGMTGFEVANQLEWDESSAQALSVKLAGLTQYQYCSGNSFRGESAGNFEVPEISRAYVEPKLPCVKREIEEATTAIKTEAAASTAQPVVYEETTSSAARLPSSVFFTTFILIALKMLS